MNLFDVPSDHPRNSAPDRLAVPALTLTPTDVSQYLRLDRCERFLRLRLHERNAGRAFLTEYDVTPQAIPPLLTRSGAEFEETVAAELSAEFGDAGVQDFAQEPLVGPKGKRLADNGRLVAALRGLPPGERRVICQPRLSVSLGAWRIRGDADLLWVEREPVSGALRILVTDMKSSNEVRVEHRLQVAFYQAMLAKLLADSGVFPCHIETAILYRPPAEVPPGTPGAKGTDPAADEKAERESAQAQERLGVRSARMEVVANGDAYRAEVENLVTGANSDALRVATAPFDRLFFSLGLKCDGCLYSEFCMKDAHERADVALIPFLPARDKKALASAGVRTIGQLATLKEFASPDAPDLAATPETIATVRQLSSTTVGPRLDELVLRARGNRASQKMGLRGLSYLPSKGHTTLPFTSPEHNPNLVCVYIDAQHDYLHDRVYLLGALVVAHEDGVPVRRRHIVHLTDGPPDSPESEAELFAVWIRETIAAIVTLAASNAADERRAPIHLVFWNDFGQRLLLDALARNMTPMVSAAPALYDFVTQMAAFDSPIATFLDDEIRERKNYPMFCQSLTAISQYLGFAWDESATGGKDWRKVFRERLFDRGGKSVFERTQAQETETGDGNLAPIEEFYERRSRHSSQIPLEYAYAAWGAVPPPIKPTKTDSFAPYRKATRENLVAFQRRRLDAVAHIAADFEGNRLTEKSTFSLPDLATFRERANHLAGALREFGVIERHVALAAWKTGRQLPPERRVLLGETLLVRYVEGDQEADVAAQNRDNKVRKALKDDFVADFKAFKPDAKQVRLTPEQKAECEWSMADMPFRLRFDLTGVDADLPTILGLLNLKDGDRFILYPRWSTDTRLPLEEQTENTPTPKQMLYGTRVELLRIDVRKNEAGCPTHAFAHVSVCSPGGGSPGYLFSAMDRPLEPNALYTLDPDPNDIYGLWQSKVTDALCDLEQSATPNVHPLYSRVAHPAPGDEAVPWPPDAVIGQENFLLGLDAFRDAGLLHDFETSKRDYIGAHGDAPLLLVQGPPGTGKSYTTAFSVLARMQGAWASNRPHYRATLSCKTHSATDVLLRGVAEAIEKLESLRAAAPDIWATYFDDRILSVPLLRIASGRDTGALPDAITVLLKDSMRAKGEGRLADDVASERYAILGATPGGIYGMVKDAFGPTHLCGNALCDLLILDEASQMSLPEAMMASLTLEQEGRVIIVGDPRQMPPIVQHAWEDEPRRTFAEFRAYESLFTALVALAPPYLRFAESFRLHAVMAKYLRDEIYVHDGIDYHSRRTSQIARLAPDSPHAADPFTAAVLDPDYPLVVIVHEEARSQARNPFEETLIGPLLRALADPDGHALDARHGLGVVVPHRAQRIALRNAYPELRLLDPLTGDILVEAVDTVERYQGDERDVILVSATESDPEYLQASAAFLLDPRRLTVALSRAKRKIILVASRAIFRHFSSDEDLFHNSLLWKNLLRRTCTTPLWTGEHKGTPVEAWGAPAFLAEIEQRESAAKRGL